MKDGVSQDETECEPNYIALSLYFNDGPAPIIDDLQAITKLLQDKRQSTDDGYIIAESNFIFFSKILTKIISNK